MSRNIIFVLFELIVTQLVKKPNSRHYPGNNCVDISIIIDCFESGAPD
jgi:hypothetical protein